MDETVVLGSLGVKAFDKVSREMKALRKFLPLLMLLPGILWAEDYRISSSVKTLPDEKTRFVEAKAHFPFAPDLLWQLLDRPEEFPKYLPRVKACDSLHREVAKDGQPDTEKLYINLDLIWPFPDLWNVVRITRDPGMKKLEWSKLYGNLNRNTGTLDVTPEGAGSLVKMEILVDPGMHIPRWIVAWGANHYVPKILGAFGKKLGEEKKKLDDEKKKQDEAVKKTPV